MNMALSLIAFAAVAAVTYADPVNVLSLGIKNDGSEDVGAIVKVYVRSDSAATMSVRFTTTYMCDSFRPLDHGSLRKKDGTARYRYVLTL